MKEDFILAALDKKKSEDAFRTLLITNHLIDFTSNDYLGLSNNAAIREAVIVEIAKDKEKKIGSTGSRLLTGNSEYIESLEQKIATFHHAESALIFNSGYDANIGLISCMAKKEDTIICDELCHASIIDGMRLSLAGKKYKFKHNNVEDLEKKILNAKGRVFVIIEAIYSMDGDEAPLANIVQLANKHGAYIILDEAHSNGILGPLGCGIANTNGLEKYFLARIYTFGKALGSHGAAVVGSKALINYLINFARSFIYTTALPFHCLVSINCAYNYLAIADNERQKLFKIISFYRSKLDALGLEQSTNNSPIQSFIKSGNTAVRKLALTLQKNQFNTRAILSPTIPKGKERIRICLHSFNTEAEINNLLETIAEFESCKV
jgi:8-amino-7-oxononanoate synthase